MSEGRVLNLDAVDEALKITVDHVENVMVVARGISTVKDQASAETAAGILSQIADARKQVDEARLATTKPFRDETASINERFKEILGPLNGIEQALREMVKDYRAKEQARLDEENAKAQAEYERAQEMERQRSQSVGVPPRKIEAPEMKSVETLTTSTGRKVGTQKRWTYEIVDVEALPRQYMKPDGAKVQAAVRDGVREIPGVHIFQTEDVTVR